MLTNKEKEYLELAVSLAEEALNKGDQPFGPVTEFEDRVKALHKEYYRK